MIPATCSVSAVSTNMLHKLTFSLYLPVLKKYLHHNSVEENFNVFAALPSLPVTLVFLMRLRASSVIFVLSARYTEW